MGGGGPENAVVVVNADNPDSVAVAAKYVKLRSMHTVNVINLRGLPAGPVNKVADFRDKILQPVLSAIRERGLSRQIDYIIYSAGFPYAVDVSEDMAGKSFPRYITQPASLTGLTYLADLVLARNLDYLSLEANWYCRRPKAAKADSPWSDGDRREQADLTGLQSRIQEARKKKDEAELSRLLNEAAAKSRSLMERHPNSPDLLYDIACLLALNGQPDEAMSMLAAARRGGWRFAALTAMDPDLESLHSRDDFKRLLDEMRSTRVEMQPGMPFRHSTGWGANGEPAAGGRHYYLSAMLTYTGLISAEEACRNLRAAVAADGTCPKGTIYFMISTDGARTGPREWAFEPAAAALRKLGVQAEVLKGTLPPSKSDVAGTMVGAASFDWKSCGSTILPGAFCDHLTSFGGVMAGAGQTVLTEFLRNGAAGASGTVTEPYAIQAKFPNAFLHVYYASGCTLGESFYQSVQGPYQILLVGDPLCKPWAKPKLTR